LIQSESIEAKQERSGSQLWGNSIAESVVAASELMRQWGIPLTDTLSDCVMLDDLINRYAPDGDFPTEGEFSALHHAGPESVARVLSLYISNLLVQDGRALWSPDSAKSCGIISERDRVNIPVENFVKERLLLGASGDNFSALESLIVEMDMGLAKGSPGADMGWWKPAGVERLSYFKEEAEWMADMLSRLGMGPSRTLSDLEGLDAWIDSMFEPGGMLAPDMKGRIPVDMDRFIVGLGLFVGETIASNSVQVWFDHEKPEGISILSHALGRLFPVARMQRRVYLASAADFSAKLLVGVPVPCVLIIPTSSGFALPANRAPSIAR
jgi:hypothetical protein